MATVNLGAIKFNWKGAYNNSTAYAVDDVVSSGGSSYICILASQGNAVSNSTYWNQMSAAGTNGTNGTDVGTTITTQGDILYRDGSGLQRLAAGTSGQFLKTQGSGANPVWSDNSSDYVKLVSHKVTGNSTTTINFDQCISSDYRLYKLHATYKLTGGTAYLSFRYREGASGSETTFSNGNYRYNNNAFTDNGGNARGNGNDGGTTQADLDNDSGDHAWNNLELQFALPNAGNSEGRPSWNGQSWQWRDSSSNFFVNSLGGFVDATINPTGIQLYHRGGGNITANSNFKLFGIKE
jgi:hypothetical protein